MKATTVDQLLFHIFRKSIVSITTVYASLHLQSVSSFLSHTVVKWIWRLSSQKAGISISPLVIDSHLLSCYHASAIRILSGYMRLQFSGSWVPASARVMGLLPPPGRRPILHEACSMESSQFVRSTLCFLVNIHSQLDANRSLTAITVFLVEGSWEVTVFPFVFNSIRSARAMRNISPFQLLSQTMLRQSLFQWLR